jgi:hypothetical protein
MADEQLKTVSRYLSPDQIAVLLAIHVNTVHRWLRDGVARSSGGRLRPESVRTPGGWRVREDHLWVFLDAVKADRTRPDTEEAPEVPRPIRSQRAARLDEKLAAAGF